MRKVGVVLFSLVFLVLCSLSMILLSINYTAINANFYKKILTRNNAYQRLLSTDPKFFVGLLFEEGDEVVFEATQIENMIKKISPETLKTITESLIDTSIFGILKSSDSNFSINLTELKKEIRADGSDQISNIYADTIPDDLNWEMGNQYESFRIIPRLFSTVIWLMIAISVILLAIIVLLCKTWAGRLRAIGINLFIVSIPLVTLSILGLYLIPINIKVYPEISDLVLDLVQDVKDTYFTWMLAIAVVVALVALVTYIFSIILEKKTNIVLAKGDNAKR